MSTDSLARNVPSASTSYANSFLVACAVTTATARDGPPLPFAAPAPRAEEDLPSANRYQAPPISTSAAATTITRPLRVTYSVSLPPAAGGSGSKRKEKYLTSALPNDWRSGHQSRAVPRSFARACRRLRDRIPRNGDAQAPLQ